MEAEGFVLLLLEVLAGRNIGNTTSSVVRCFGLVLGEEERWSAKALLVWAPQPNPPSKREVRRKEVSSRSLQEYIHVQYRKVWVDFNRLFLVHTVCM